MATVNGNGYRFDTVQEVRKHVLERAGLEELPPIESLLGRFKGSGLKRMPLSELAFIDDFDAIDSQLIDPDVLRKYFRRNFRRLNKGQPLFSRLDFDHAIDVMVDILQNGLKSVVVVSNGTVEPSATSGRHRTTLFWFMYGGEAKIPVLPLHFEDENDARDAALMECADTRNSKRLIGARKPSIIETAVADYLVAHRDGYVPMFRQDYRLYVTLYLHKPDIIEVEPLSFRFGEPRRQLSDSGNAPMSKAVVEFFRTFLSWSNGQKKPVSKDGYDAQMRVGAAFLNAYDEHLADVVEKARKLARKMRKTPNREERAAKLAAYAETLEKVRVSNIYANQFMYAVGGLLSYYLYGNVKGDARLQVGVTDEQIQEAARRFAISASDNYLCGGETRHGAIEAKIRMARRVWADDETTRMKIITDVLASKRVLPDGRDVSIAWVQDMSTPKKVGWMGYPFLNKGEK